MEIGYTKMRNDLIRNKKSSEKSPLL